MFKCCQLKHLAREHLGCREAGWFLDQLPGGIANDGGIIRNIFNDNGTCADDHIIADGDTLADHGISADESAPTNFDVSAEYGTGCDMCEVTNNAFVIDAGRGITDHAAPDLYHGVERGIGGDHHTITHLHGGGDDGAGMNGIYGIPEVLTKLEMYLLTYTVMAYAGEEIILA